MATANPVVLKLAFVAEARPTADLCIDCKTLAEIRENRWRVNPGPVYHSKGGSLSRLITDMSESHYIGRFAPSPPVNYISAR